MFRSTRERFPHPYTARERFPHPSPIDVEPPNPTPSGPSVFTGTPPRIHPIRGSVFLLAHRPMSGSDTICNSSKRTISAIGGIMITSNTYFNRELKYENCYAKFVIVIRLYE